VYFYKTCSSKDDIADVDGNDTVPFFFSTFVIGKKLSPGHASFNTSSFGKRRGEGGNDTDDQRHLQIVQVSNACTQLLETENRSQAADGPIRASCGLTLHNI